MSLRIPKYRLHKASGQALIQIDGCRVYLGKHGTPESRERYRRLLAEWLNGRQPPTRAHPAAARACYSEILSVNDLLLAYWRFAQEYYRKNGRLTGETENIRSALRPLRRLYGSTPAADCGPDALEIVRQAMIDGGLSRGVINGRVSRIKRMFRWASKKRFVPAETYHGLRAVEGLQRGRSKARETKPVTTVSERHVKAVLPQVSPQVRAMVQVQELAGMRPQDVRNMRTRDLDMSSDVWVYTPWTHKTEHHGHVRQVAVGPKAQAILRPFLKMDDPLAYIFSPKEAVAVLRAERRRQRKTPTTPSERKKRLTANPKRAPGIQYTKSSYENAIARACEKADVPRWAPNRLRHNCGTKVRRKYGIEGAAAVLGNSLGMVAEVYSEANFEKAIDIMREMG